MAQAILTITGKVVPRRTCSKVTTTEWNSSEEKHKRNQFDDAITKLFGDSMHIPDVKVKNTLDLDMIDFTDGDANSSSRLLVSDPVSVDCTAEFEPLLLDLFLHAKLMLP